MRTRGPEIMTIIGDHIAAAAEKWIGTPFPWQAQVRGVGCDCKGLVAGVARDCGRAEADEIEALAADYGAVVDVMRLRAGLDRLFDRVAISRAGDVLLVRIGGKAQHLAIAAPTAMRPSRAIQALDTGPRQVIATGVPRALIAGVYRWKDV